MKKTVWLILCVSMLLLTSCTNVQSRDKKLYKELDEQGWSCNHSGKGDSCSYYTMSNNYFISSDSFIYGWSISNEIVQIYGQGTIDLRMGDITHEIEGEYKEDESNIKYRIIGNIYKEEYSCTTNDESLEHNYLNVMFDSYDLIKSLIQQSGNSMRNYNQSGYSSDVSTEIDINEICEIDDDM